MMQWKKGCGKRCDGKTHWKIGSTLSLYVFPFGFNNIFFLLSFLRHVFFSISREKLLDTRICPVFDVCLLCILVAYFHTKWNCIAHWLTNLIIFSCESLAFVLIFFSFFFASIFLIRNWIVSVFFCSFHLRWKVASTKQTRKATASVIVCVCNCGDRNKLYIQTIQGIDNKFIYFPVVCFHKTKRTTVLKRKL